MTQILTPSTSTPTKPRKTWKPTAYLLIRHTGSYSKPQLNIPFFVNTETGEVEHLFNLLRNIHATIRDIPDLPHSAFESRFYALGRLRGHGVIKINYMYRGGRVRIISAYRANRGDKESLLIGFNE